MKSLYLLCLIMFVKCNSQNKNTFQTNDIKEVIYSKFDSEPILDNYNKQIIKFNKDSISLIQEIFENREKIKVKKIKSIENIDFKTFLSIPELYLNKKKDYEYLNYFPENDGGGIRVMFLRTEDTIVWTLSCFKEDLPKELQKVHEVYDKAKIELKSNNE